MYLGQKQLVGLESKTKILLVFYENNSSIRSWINEAGVHMTQTGSKTIVVLQNNNNNNNNEATAAGA